MKKSLWIILAVVVLMVFMGMGTYNRLVTSEEAVTSAWSQVENVYQRRADLIPNLVETVKGYAAHERETLEGVINARSKATQVTVGKEAVENPQALAKFQQAQGELSSALSRLMVVVERYPDLKANQNFLALQSQLEGTENRITVERRRYNETAQAFNTMRRRFPTVLFANLGGFGAKTYFEAQEGAEKAPAVKF